MNTRDVHESLLRGLAPGAVMWLSAAGQSLWPLLLDGDSLRIERVEPTQLRLGDIAVVKLPTGVLAAHLVAGLEPLQTSSSVGLLDPQPIEALGRVIGFRRGEVVHEWPEGRRHFLRFVPGFARLLKRLPLTRRAVGLLRRIK
jgi:hypothetical protein